MIKFLGLLLFSLQGFGSVLLDRPLINLSDYVQSPGTIKIQLERNASTPEKLKIIYDYQRKIQECVLWDFFDRNHCLRYEWTIQTSRRGFELDFTKADPVADKSAQTLLLTLHQKNLYRSLHEQLESQESDLVVKKAPFFGFRPRFYVQQR